MLKSKVLLTGATGFVGKALAKSLLDSDYEVIALVRKFSDELPISVKQLVIGDLTLLSKRKNHNSYKSKSKSETEDSTQTSSGDLESELRSVDAVVHAAARVHVPKNSIEDDLTVFRRVNLLATIMLAELAESAGVKRFVFISTIGVNGCSTNTAFTENDKPSPHSNYALTKWEAEEKLKSISKKTEMEVVIIRPPLIYGKGAPGNFNKLITLVRSGIPLPLAKIGNRRSFIAIDNLVDFIMLSLTHRAAANETFLVSDGADITTSELMKKLASALNVSLRLFYFPPTLLKFLMRIIGHENTFEQLWGTLQIDITKAKKELGWRPEYTMEEVLKSLKD